MVKRKTIGSSKQDVEGDDEGVEAHQQFWAMSMGADAVLNAATGMHQNGESPEGDAGDSTDSRAIGDKRQRHDDMREETSTAIDRRPLTVKWFNDIMRFTVHYFAIWLADWGWKDKPSRQTLKNVFRTMRNPVFNDREGEFYGILRRDIVYWTGHWSQSGETSRLNPPEFLEEDPEEEIIDVCVDRVFARMKAGLQAETRPRVKIDKQVQTDPPTQTEQKVQADQQVQTEEQGRSGEQPKPGTQAQLEVKMQVGAQMRSEAHVHIDLQLKLSTAPA
ncbi:uncharacterized protein UBRO_04727-B [Ustilago bromivora]|uniref:Uncharacterized protein n=1 Tax=Ustilago bromivora TaxID=307758 RepID=A0A1K0G496_9BASI|nr:uncharacterized protein UBRO_04727-B [Ustilago bromivora]